MEGPGFGAANVNAIGEFIVAGSPQAVAEAIEACALAQGIVGALVVPWESAPTGLSMAVTAVQGDGWAIEHTTLGTITLTADGGATRVAVIERIARESDEANTAALAALFERFARDVRARLTA